MYLQIDLVDHPLETLPPLAGVHADPRRYHVLHVVAERHPLHTHGRLLLQERLRRIGGVRRVVQHLVHRDVTAERQINRLQRHYFLLWVYF